MLVRRAFRLVLADDPRPLPERLTHEAKRVLLIAGVIAAVVAAVVVAAIVAAVWALT